MEFVLLIIKMARADLLMEMAHIEVGLYIFFKLPYIYTGKQGPYFLHMYIIKISLSQKPELTLQ